MKNPNLFAPGLGVIGFRSCSRPTVGFLIRSLLSAYRYPFISGGETQMYARRGVLIDLIRQKGTRLLFIDEAAGLLTKPTHSRTQKSETEPTDLLREIGDACQISLVLASAECLDAIDQLDPALSQRISVRTELKNFLADGQWLGFLRAYVKQCDVFDLAIITDNSVAKRMHLTTNGNLRQFKRLITEAVLLAVDANRESISVEDLSVAFPLVNGQACGKENVFQ